MSSPPTTTSYSRWRRHTCLSWRISQMTLGVQLGIMRDQRRLIKRRGARDSSRSAPSPLITYWWLGWFWPSSSNTSSLWVPPQQLKGQSFSQRSSRSCCLFTSRWAPNNSSSSRPAPSSSNSVSVSRMLWSTKSLSKWPTSHKTSSWSTTRAC